MRSFFKGFAFAALIVSWTFFVLLQMARGGYTYRVQNGREQYCFVICIPGQEPYFDFSTMQVETQFSLTRRVLISSWYDNGPSTTPIDNPVASP